MSIYRDKRTGRWRFDFDHIIQGQGRVRKRRLLPAGWTRAQAEAYDRKESAALHAIAKGIASPRAYIDHAVTRYAAERVPHLKAGAKALVISASPFPGRHQKRSLEAPSNGRARSQEPQPAPEQPLHTLR